MHGTILISTNDRGLVTFNGLGGGNYNHGVLIQIEDQFTSSEGYVYRTQ